MHLGRFWSFWPRHRRSKKCTEVRLLFWLLIILLNGFHTAALFESEVKAYPECKICILLSATQSSAMNHALKKQDISLRQDSILAIIHYVNLILASSKLLIWIRVHYIMCTPQSESMCTIHIVKRVCGIEKKLSVVSLTWTIAACLHFIWSQGPKRIRLSYYKHWSGLNCDNRPALKFDCCRPSIQKTLSNSSRKISSFRRNGWDSEDSEDASDMSAYPDNSDDPPPLPPTTRSHQVCNFSFLIWACKVSVECEIVCVSVVIETLYSRRVSSLSPVKRLWMFWWVKLCISNSKMAELVRWQKSLQSVAIIWMWNSAKAYHLLRRLDCL